MLGSRLVYGGEITYSSTGVGVGNGGGRQHELGTLMAALRGIDRNAHQSRSVRRNFSHTLWMASKGWS